MDPAVELSLLQKRFPDRQISECGKLISDFFCARDVSSHTHEGRLFVTEKALLFVSTYSRDFDLFLFCSDIEQATATKRRIIPTLELTLSSSTHPSSPAPRSPSSPERFTNFYNMAGVLAALRPLLLPDRVTELAPQGPPPKLSRFTSVQPVARPCSTSPVHLATTASHDPATLPARPKVDPCPFFVKSGFCPRRLLCKLDHTPSNRDQPDDIAKDSDEGKSPPTQPGMGSPAKKFHLSDSADNVAQDVPLLSDESLPGGGIEFLRSISLPATQNVMWCQKMDEPHSKSLETVSNPANSSSRSHPDGQTIADASEQVEPTLPSKMQGISPELPQTFEFSKHALISEDDTQNESETKDGVFVFTATSPTGDEVVKKKNSTVSFDLSSTGDGVRVVSGDGVRVVSGDGGRLVAGSEPGEDVATLAQQLGLDSDNDSLKGDLDLDYQRNLLATFRSQGEDPSLTTPTFPAPPPPPPPPLPGTSSSAFLPPSYDLATRRDAGTLPSYEELQSSDVVAKPVVAGGDEKEGAGHPLKRRPCIYFLSGFCRNGSDCPDYHGMDLNMEELEYVSERSDVPLPSTLKVCPASAISRSDIDSGDKIILSPQVLMVCEMLELSYPMAFKLEHVASGQLVHAGVLEFTSPEPDVGYLPQWMFDHLQASPGDEVEFEHVELPKGTFVRLQPVSSAWLGIPYDKRLAMMEFQLRNFQTLTEGTRVTLTYELNRYTLKVLQCKPAKGISILDADITTDIIEPADLNRFHSVEEGQAEHTGLGEGQHCTVDCSSYRHFVLLSLPGQPLPPRLSVTVEAGGRGDPDLFLSHSCTAPTQSRYTWCNQDVGNSVITLSPDDKDYDINKPLYAGVVSLDESAEFTITFQDASDIGLEVGQTLRSSSSDPHHLPTSTAPTSTTSPTDEPDSAHLPTDPADPADPPPGHQRCSYCGSVMPALRLLMHERHCALSTFKCPLCSRCMPKAGEKKHHYIAHQLLVCECGEEHTQLALHGHQQTSCCKRSVHCPFKWCSLSFPMDQLREHEAQCARKRLPCPVCGEEVSRLETEQHLQAFHSVDTLGIQWDKPLGPQVAALQSVKPSFVCPCGSSFDFQDDLQVHQLTECSRRRMSEDDHPSSETIQEADLVG